MKKLMNLSLFLAIVFGTTHIANATPAESIDETGAVYTRVDDNSIHLNDPRSVVIKISDAVRLVVDPSGRLVRAPSCGGRWSACYGGMIGPIVNMWPCEVWDGGNGWWYCGCHNYGSPFDCKFGSAIQR